MNKHFLTVVVFLISMGFAQAGSAQMRMSDAQKAAGPWYVGGGIGWTDAEIPTQTVDAINAGLTAANGASVGLVDKDRRSTGIKAFLGYSFNRYYSVEGGYAFLGNTKANMDFRSGSPSSSVGTFNMKYKMTAFFFDAVGNLPIGDKWSLMGRLGVAYGKTSADLNGSPLTIVTTSNDRSEGKVRPKFGAGIVYNINAALSARAEWERYKLPDPLSDERFNVDAVTLSMVLHF